HIRRNLLHCVGLDRLRLVRAAIAAHVDGASGEASIGERLHLAAPGVPALREAVHHDDERPLALDCCADFDAVGFDQSEFVCHCRSAGKVGWLRMLSYAAQRAALSAPERSTKARTTSSPVE